MADRPAAAAFNVTRNVRLLYAYQLTSLLQPHIAIWVVYLTDFRGLTLTQVGLLETFFWGVSLLAEVRRAPAPIATAAAPETSQRRPSRRRAWRSSRLRETSRS